MNKFIFLFTILIGFTVVSCKKDDPDPASYSFIDQNAQGKIGNENWEVQNGFADAEPSDNTLRLTMVQTTGVDGCSIMPDGNQVFFYVPKAIGVYKLNFDINNWESEENQTVTLYRDSDGMNFIASKGAIEILSISDNLVTGRMDARAESEDDTFVNGNFSLTICN